MLGMSISPMSTIVRLGFGTVPTECYFLYFILLLVLYKRKTLYYIVEKVNCELIQLMDNIVER